MECRYIDLRFTVSKSSSCRRVLGRLIRADEEPEDKEVRSLLENMEKVLGKFDRGMSISAA